MISANIYTHWELSPYSIDAVHEGIGLVAAYMGQELTAQEVRITKSLEGRHAIDPYNFDLCGFDSKIDLHMFAIPIVDSDVKEYAGAAWYERGFSFVEPRTTNHEVIRNTSAHETAHAFGFVMPNSPQNDNYSNECVGEECMLYNKVNMIPEDVYVRPKGLIDVAAGKIGKFVSYLNREPFEETSADETKNARPAYDFCRDCKDDMDMYGGLKVNLLRNKRKSEDPQMQAIFLS